MNARKPMVNLLFFSKIQNPTEDAIRKAKVLRELTNSNIKWEDRDKPRSIQFTYSYLKIPGKRYLKSDPEATI